MGRKSRMLITVLGTLASASSTSFAHAADADVIKQFFSNYALIAKGGVQSPHFAQFKEAQSKVLSEELVTIVSDDRGITQYDGRSEYFKSIDDWSRKFGTKKDFKVGEPIQEDNNRYRVSLTGTIVYKTSTGGFDVPDSIHCWSEVFTLDSEGRIRRLEVHMNLACR